MLLWSLLLFISLFFSVGNLGCACQGPASTSAYLAQKTHPSVYDRLERPGARSGIPDEIEAQLFMTQMNEVSEKLGQVTVGGYFRTYWSDTRLAFNSTADGGCFDKVNLIGNGVSRSIWTPDLYFDNLVSSSTEDQDASMYSISPDGSVWFSEQISITVRCSFVFGKVPFDKQTCSVVVASYSMNNSMVRLAAKGGTIGAGTSGTGIVGQTVTSPVWNLETSSGTAGIVDVRASSDNQYWDYLSLRWSFARKPLYFTYQVFFPETLFLIISYGGVFVDGSAAPARATVATIPLLTLRVLSNSVYKALPQVSDSMWISDYLLGSMCLACLVAAHFCFVQFLRIREKRRDEKLNSLLSIEQTAKALLANVRSEGFTLLEVLNEIFPSHEWENALAPQRSVIRGPLHEHPPLSGQNTESCPNAVGMPHAAASEHDSHQHMAAVVCDADADVFAQPQDDRENLQPDFARQQSKQSTRSVKEVWQSSKSLEVTEIDVSVILWARNLFVEFGKDQSVASHLGPHAIRRLLWRFNVYWSLEDTAKIMCMFLRDHNVNTPSDEMSAQISFGQFCEFLFEARHYNLAVRTKHRSLWSTSMPSEFADMVLRWLFPCLLALKMSIFIAAVDSYT